MKKLVLLFTALIFGTASTLASTTDDKVAIRNAYQNNNSFIFVENGITFSVFPDGEFDFYIDNHLGRQRNNVTFNSGYDYSPYAQYDDYGAIIQVENIPIYYDNFGRVTEIGNIDINYRRNRVNRVGGMYVYYNRNGYYDYHTGYINRYNRHYVYRPFHRLFVRPSINFCLVFNTPYRRYYNATRYTYYSPYRHNTRRTYAKIGREHRYSNARDKRSKVYRNDKRVAVRTSHVRGNRNSARSTGNTKYRSSNNKTRRATTTGRTNTARKTVANRNQRGNTATKSTSYRRSGANNSGRNVATKRTVTKSPRGTTVTRSTTYRRPANKTANRAVTKRVTRSSPVPSRNSKSRVANTSTRNKTNKYRSTSSRKVTKSPSRSTRNNSKSTGSRTSRRL